MSARISLLVAGDGGEPRIGEGFPRSSCEVITLGGPIRDLDGALARATAPTVAVVEPGSFIDGHSLRAAIDASAPLGRTAIVYTDERAGGEVVRKPPWLVSELEREDYLGRMVLLPRALANVAGFGTAPDETVRRLVLRAHACGIEVRHVPEVAHDGRRRPPVATAPCVGPGPRVPLAAGLGAARPHVSVLMPTAGSRVHDGRSPQVRALRALDAVRRASGSRATQVIVVVGPEVDRAALGEIHALGMPLDMVVDHLPFDFSRRINLAAARAQGSVLVLLNDDVERDADDEWLHELVELAGVADVGAVGARLLYPDRSIQHAGVWLYDGFGRHIGRGLPEHARGPEGYLTQARQQSAVTGAVLATRADVFAEVGGLTASLAVNWNDIDYCLKVRARGYRVVWTPRATLVHDESSTRAPGVSAEEMDTWRARWPEAEELHWPWLDDQGTVPSPPGQPGASPSAAR